MDNQKIDVMSEGDAGIDAALSIIWDKAAPGGKATHYRIERLKNVVTYHGTPTTSHCECLAPCETGRETLILFWREDADTIKLPYPLDRTDAAIFIRGWLSHCDYGREPDHDGDNGRGWRVFNEAWGMVRGSHASIIAIQPVWALYGK